MKTKQTKGIIISHRKPGFLEFQFMRKIDKCIKSTINEGSRTNNWYVPIVQYEIEKKKYLYDTKTAYRGYPDFDIGCYVNVEYEINKPSKCTIKKKLLFTNFYGHNNSNKDKKENNMKDWNEIEKAYKKMSEMSCRPNFTKKKDDYISDEDKSVKWNREQIQINNKKYDDEVSRLNTAKNKARDSIHEDIYGLIQYELDNKISKEAARAIWSYAYDKGHSCGFHDIEAELSEINDLVRIILKNQ